MPDSYAEISTVWTFEAVVQANELIETIEAALATQRRRNKPKTPPLSSRRR